MLLATRQLAGSAGRPARSQPSTYFGQWLFTQAGIKKLAEIGSQPRAAASVTPLEKGATTVTTMGGCGFCSGLARMPWPMSAFSVRRVLMVQYLPSISYGGAPAQIASTWSIASTNMAL